MEASKEQGGRLHHRIETGQRIGVTAKVLQQTTEICMKPWRNHAMADRFIGSGVG